MFLMDALVSGINTFFSCYPQSKPWIEEVRNARIIAHRGAHDSSKGILENTIPAFQRALDLNCWGIELDVHSTKDHVFVVHHDQKLNRLWKHPYSISQMDYTDLHQLVPEIPRLDEIVAFYGKKLHLFIELKTPFQHESVLQKTLAPLDEGEDYHLLSLNSKLFQAMELFKKKTLLLVPVHYNAHAFTKISLDNDYGGILGHYLLLSDKKIKRLRDAGQSFGVGFVNSKMSLFRELNRGIPWIFTDQAVIVSHAFNELVAD